MATATRSAPAAELAVKHADFTIERTFEASPSQVFRAFADPAAKARWFVGPEGWAKPSGFSLDFRVGGRERVNNGPVGGPVHTFDGIYHDIVADRRIVYSYDMYRDGERTSVSLATIELAPVGDATRLTFTEQDAFLDGSEPGADRERGTRDLLDNLAAYVARSHNVMKLSLPSDLEIAVTRDFDAPRSLIFDAWSKCEHLARWWGPRSLELAVCDLDFREGGAYRFVSKAPDGTMHPFKGEFRVIRRPERVVFTQIYDVPPINDYEVLVTTVLTEENGRTHLSQTLAFNSIQSRDGMIASGMEWGQAQSFERLDDLLAEMQASAV